MSTTSTIRPRADSLSTIRPRVSNDSTTCVRGSDESNREIGSNESVLNFCIENFDLITLTYIPPENNSSHIGKSSENIFMENRHLPDHIEMKTIQEQRDPELLSQSSREPLVRESEKARIITPVMKDKGMFRNMWKKFVEGFRTVVFCGYVH
jgi:hypothetical protein